MNCSVVFFLLALTGLALFGYRRLARHVSALRARLEDMELELARLRSRLEQKPLTETAPAVGEAATELEPAPTEPVEVTTPSPPAEPEPEPVAPAATTGAPAEAGRAAAERAEEPPPSPPPSAPPLEPAPPSRPPIDLEQWIGVRGAAVLGGVVLAIAGFFFLRYSIEAGWLKPAVRVVLGVLAGLGSLAGAQVLRRRDYDAAANALSGAGIVLLYAATWAARVLYGFIGYAPAFVLMALVTVTCGVLSWRYRSLVVALLGLLGGFATPLLLTSGRDNPLGLFGYLLLLNTGLAVLARRSRWPLLGHLSLAATFFYQTLWIFARMDTEDGLLALAILAVFAVFFVVTGGALRRAAADRRTERPWLQMAALATPFAFALYFAANAELRVGLVPLAALLALLAGAAAWLARVHRVPFLEEGIAAATVAVIATWWVQSAAQTSSWAAVLVTVGLAAVFHLAVELEHRRSTEPATDSPRGALVAALGLLGWLVAVLVLARQTDFWALVTGWLGLAALLLRQSVLRRSPRRHLLAAAALAAGFFLLILDEALGGRGLPRSPEAPGLLALMIAVGVAFQAFAIRRGKGERLAQTSAAIVAATPLLGLIFLPELATLPFHGAGALLVLLVLVAATRSSSVIWYAAATVLLALGHIGWTLASGHEASELTLALPVQFGAAALLTFWPLLTGARLEQPMALRIASLAAPLWFFSVEPMFEDLFGDTAIGVVPIALGALSLGAVAAARSRIAAEPSRRRVALVWFAAVALTLVSVAIPLQVHREWITVGWALEGFAILLLWKRLDHPGLKVFALALLAAASVRLVANPALLEYHAKAALPVLNWLLYTYLVPAAALVGAARILEPLEVGRRRLFEDWLYRRGKPIGAYAAGLAAIVVVFAWINLTITDAFSPGPTLLFDWDRLPARDLTLSLAWALYALVLLGLGVARSSVGLRWISLAVLVLTIGKVFLYDLGELRDLYRVASLVALAASLILVSLLYQRFVFRKPLGEPPA